MFKFRTLNTYDFPLLLEWLSKEHIRRWWNDGDDTLEKVAQHYGKKEADVARFILVELETGIEKPIGYFQYYLVSNSTIGIDQFIGDENRVNRGIGEKTIRMFVELILRERKPTIIILDPSPDNKRAIRCYEKVGFKHYETKKAEDGSFNYMMRLDT